MPAPACSPIAVIDFETTGMSPAQGARATEIAIVLLDERGRVAGRFQSLVNTGAWIDGGLENRDPALADHPTDRAARRQPGGEVRAFVAIDRRRDSDDEDIAIGQSRFVGREAQGLGVSQFVRGGLQRPIMPKLQLGDALAVDVEAHHRIFRGQGHGERQADIAQADHANLRRCLGERIQQHRSVSLAPRRPEQFRAGAEDMVERGRRRGLVDKGPVGAQLVAPDAKRRRRQI